MEKEKEVRVKGKSTLLTFGDSNQGTLTWGPHLGYNLRTLGFTLKFTKCVLGQGRGFESSLGVLGRGVRVSSDGEEVGIDERRIMTHACSCTMMQHA